MAPRLSVVVSIHRDSPRDFLVWNRSCRRRPGLGFDGSGGLQYCLVPMRRLLTSCFGLGWLPVAPGTWGSLPPALLLGLLGHFDIGLWGVRAVMGVVILSAGILCVCLAPATIVSTGRKDPGEVVVDEVAGQAVTFLAVPAAFWAGATPLQTWLTALAGFLLFRFFDISKIWPIRRLEKLPAGWGILADDLWAGIYAMVALALGIRVIAV